MFSASGHRSTTPSSSFSTLSSCSEELHNFALSTSLALYLSLSLTMLLSCSSLCLKSTLVKPERTKFLCSLRSACVCLHFYNNVSVLVGSPLPPAHRLLPFLFWLSPTSCCSYFWLGVDSAVASTI